MTHTEVNTAIAEFCGWDGLHKNDDGDWCGLIPDAEMMDSQGAGQLNFPIPSYTTDLNEMHEAEKLLTFDQFHITYKGLLQSITEQQWIEANGEGQNRGQQSACHATAYQRAVSLLKTIDNYN